jgi:hypothetical protein
VVDGGKDRGGDGHDRLLGAAPGFDAVELGQFAAKAVRECKSILVEASVPNRFVTQPFEFEFELVSQMQHAALQINDHQVIR